MGIGKRNIHDDHRFFSRFFCALTARRRELEDAQKQFHALASRISAEEQSRDAVRGCSRGGFGQVCHKIFRVSVLPLNIQARHFRKTLPSLHGRKVWEMLL